MVQQLARNLWWPLLVVAVVAVSGLAVVRGVGNLGRVQDELQQVRQANLRLERDNRAMYRLVQRLRSDPQAVERACRRDMGFVRGDEVVYQLAPAEARPPAVKEQP